ncbi:MAG: 3,4-dihydroxy-2-butanone-4-phosphate synthase [Saprospiraceae bacterium]
METTIDDIQLDTIESAILAIKSGQVIIVVDDEDRENEGDFICAAECVSPEIINFMATHGRGLICAPINEDRADELGLHMMVPDNTSHHETAFTVSIDLIGRGCSTGISAYDRATGIRALIEPDVKASDFAKPGHIFPLRAKAGGVLRRTGHTEASIDLARLAGFYPAGVLVEILNEDGTMARLPELLAIAKRFDLKLISIKDLVAYRMQTESLIRKENTVHIDSRFGPLTISAYTQVTSGDIHMAVQIGSWEADETVTVRVHSTLETGDVLGLILQDYGNQINRTLEYLQKEGKGVLLFMRNSEKDRSILTRLSEIGHPHDQPTYNPSDQRDFGIGAQILRDLGISKLKLISRQPKRRIGLEGYGLEIEGYVQLN